MSTTESKRNPSQDPPQSRKQGNPIQPPAQHRSGNRKPLPFDDDDDDNPEQGDVVKTTNPNVENIQG